MTQVRYLKWIVLVTAVAIFTIQMIFALQKYNDNPSMINSGTKTIYQLERPIMITICKKHQFDRIQVEHLGYGHIQLYFNGKTNNVTTMSWTGLTGNLTFNETLWKIFNPDLADIQVDVPSTTRFLVPFGFCKVIEGSLQQIVDKELDRFRITFIKGTYQVFVSDPAITLSFNLPYSTMTGDAIQMQSNSNASETRKLETYRVALKETNVKKGDGTCMDYLNDEENGNYTECIHKDNEKRILPVLGCMIPWLSQKDICLNPMVKPLNFKKLEKWIHAMVNHGWSGTQYSAGSSCPTPCTFVSPHAKYHGLTNIVNRKNILDIYFEKVVNVETILPAYDFTALLIEVGSSLGLWLGLSVVGIFDVIVLVVTKLQQVMKNSILWKRSTDKTRAGGASKKSQEPERLF